MPFYQVFCIAAHNRSYVHIKDLVRSSALHVMNNGGVVRGVKFWGTQVLPNKMRRNRVIHTHGDYWTMHFDASPDNQKNLARIMRKDPRVIRATMLKMGERIEDVAHRTEQTVKPNRRVAEYVASLIDREAKVPPSR
ncbi:hypothetical protein EWM64_g6497 [Hericium alpestre]|uniref:Ribosomal protein S6 n=1 Tax=Hericium alpestre TaxID=135208 RepID=A0A4Y9ZSH7_9AGAM|nr:hypothetical protein EWM64_g6497 [Hericium alpestre]